VGIKPGDIIEIGDEKNTVAGIGSLVLGSPLKEAHPAGTPIKAYPPAATPAKAGAVPTVPAPDTVTTTEAASEEGTSVWMHMLFGILGLAGFAALAMCGVYAYMKSTTGGKRQPQAGKRSAHLDKPKVPEVNAVAEESPLLHPERQASGARPQEESPLLPPERAQVPSYRPQEVYAPPPAVADTGVTYMQTTPQLFPTPALYAQQPGGAAMPTVASFTAAPQYSNYPSYAQPPVYTQPAMNLPYQPTAGAQSYLPASGMPTQPYLVQ
jgi:hypothetical protein